MGKYSDNQSDIFSIMDAFKTAESIETVPEDFKGDISVDEYIRITIVASGKGVNRTSVSGLLIADIFTPAGFGPTRQNFIADRLDAYLANQSRNTQSGGVTQFQASAIRPMGVDKDNSALQRAIYQIPFNFFGVLT